MKVAGNKVKHLSDLYFSELKTLYDEGEIKAILYLVFEFYLGISRNKIDIRSEENINQSDLIKIYTCHELLKGGKPLQYILGEAWFYNLKLYVNENALIPRPETEELVDLIIEENPDCKSLLDIGTGSGCIPISIKANLKKIEVSACDISSAALEVANKNVNLNGTPVNFFEADVLNTNNFIKTVGKSFDVIVSNPPYIKESEKNSLSKHVIENEPHLALFVNNEDEIIFYKKIIDVCAQLLNNGGRLYFELNPVTANDVKAHAVKSGLFVSVELIKDLNGKVRFLKGVKGR
jgi:release factor glutamine methyltransferase